ncbi:hypothetical protein ACQQ2N_18070 [Dokdonella sp. MW10]|uniref:hypothetical protein n=1 Tax=Dokdonella sp. MW10 TaxID=2992926 RepID=UPI003F7D8E6C
MSRPSVPDIGLVYFESLEDQSFSDFRRYIEADGLAVRVESRPDPGPYAGIEWLIPTAVMVYLGRSYFDAFLKEAGKDHYHILKKALHSLSSRFFGDGAPKGRIVFSKGKAESENPRYSIFYSVVAQLGDGFQVKLLLQSDFDDELCNEAQNLFLDFLSSVYDGTLDMSSVRGLPDAVPVGNTLLIAYNSKDKILEVIDPIAQHRQPGNKS